MARTDDGELDALAEAGTEGIQVAPRRSAKRGGFRSAIEELLPRSQFGDQRDIIGGAGQNVVGLAADPVTHDELRAGTPARLVLVDAMELAWQRAKYRGHQHLLLRADPGLVGLNTLQLWLWQRLQAPVASPEAA